MKKTELTIEEQAHRNRLRDLYCGVFVTTVFVWVLQFALGGLASLAQPYLNYYGATALNLLANALAVFLPFFVFQKVRRDPVLPIFRQKPRSEHPVIRSLLGAMATGGLTVGLAGLLYHLLAFLERAGVHSHITVPDFGSDLYQNIYYILLSSVLLAFSYEFAFRGVALEGMREENSLAAVLVSSVAFAFSDGHLYNVITRLAIGVLLGWFYLRVRSVWCCMVLHGASQVALSLWWFFIYDQEYAPYVNFLILICFVLGLGAAFFLFYPRRDPDANLTPNKIALKEIFTSFGIYLITVLLAFNLLVFAFSTDSDPLDPLLQPVPEEDRIPPLEFDREQEFEDYNANQNP